jgi:hypothetical protein
MSSRRRFLTTTSGTLYTAAIAGRADGENLPPGTTTGWGVPRAQKEIVVGSEPQLFCDDFLISAGSDRSRDYPLNVRFNVARARKDDMPVMLPGKEASWEKTGMYWLTVLYDGGRYRCWYNSSAYLAQRTEFPHQRPAGAGKVVHLMVAYAESDDGIHWRKPVLNLVDLEGSRSNNIVFLGDVDRYTEGVCVFVDPSAKSAERYKMAFAGPLGLRGAHSSDGLNWTLHRGTFEVRGLDTQNTATYDSLLGRYVAYIRSNSLNYGALNVGEHAVKATSRGRSVARIESDDFRAWSTPEIVLAPDILDGMNVDLYTCPYSRYRDVHFMFMSAYYHWNGKLNLQAAVSRDNRVWTRHTRATLVDNGGTGDYDEYRIYAGPGILPAGKDRLAIYTRTGTGPHPGSIDVDYQPGAWKDWRGLPEGCMGRVELQRDRIIGIEAGEVEGVFATREIIFTGRHLRLNVEPIGPTPEIRVQVVQGDKRTTQTINGLTFDDCIPLSRDDLDGVVRWKNINDLSEWSGKPVRLQFHVRSMRVYAFQFFT